MKSVPTGVPTSAGTIDSKIDRSLLMELDATPDKRNVDNISRCFSSWLALLADSPLATVYGPKPPRVFKAFRRDLIKGPLVGLIQQYSSLGHQLTLSVSGTPSDPKVAWIDGFQHTPVFKEWLEFYRGKDPALFRYLYSFCVFAKKLDFDDETLHATAFRGWLGVEERLSSLNLSSDITAGMALIMKGLVSGFDLYPFWPKFGPGAVAERGVRGIRSKSENLRFDSTIDELFYSGPHNIEALLEGRSRPYYAFVPDDSMWQDAGIKSSTTAELRFVPKDVTKSRSIAMEPNTFMYHQQGVMKSLLRCMRKTKARRFVNIQDQQRNADLARYGSVTNRIDTIDLSSASDSVHWKLVEGIFPEDVRKYLFGTRTSRVRTPDGETITVNKFAPMGSALCFPVQCLVFTTVVIYAAIQAASSKAPGEVMDIASPFFRDIDRTIDRLFRVEPGLRIRQRRDDAASWYTVQGFYEPGAVYGDDICVDSSLTQHVTHLLETLGFEVNHSKSFTGASSFRESCGGFFLWGHDVTPLRFQVVRSGETLSSNTIASYIPMVNRCGDYGFRHLRRCLLHDLLHTPWEGLGLKPKQPILFTEDRNLYGSAVISTAPVNGHLRHKDAEMSRYHREEYRHAVVVPLETEADIAVKRSQETQDHPIESYLYLRWWATRPEGIASDEASLEYHETEWRNPFWKWDKIGSSASRFNSSGTRIDWRWTPVD